MTEVDDKKEMEIRLDQIRRYLREDIGNHVFSGACVTVLDKGGVPHFVEEGTYTYQDSRPLTRTSAVDISSITKLLTALSFHRISQNNPEAAQLLHSPVHVYVPEIQSDNSDDQVTVADLLSMRVRWHTGEPLSKIMARIFSESEDEDSQREALREVMLSSRVEKLDGTDHQYQDASYITLAWILEAYFKQLGHPHTYEDIVKNMVLEPLGMNSTVRYPDRETAVPTGVRNGQLIQGIPHDTKAALFPGHAGFFSTAEDLARLAGMLQFNGHLPGQDRPFLLQPSFENLTRPQTYDPERGWWGMGIRRYSPDAPVSGHWYGKYADAHTLSLNGFSGQHLVVYGNRTAGIFLTNFHVPHDISTAEGDRPFGPIQTPRKRILETLSEPF